MMPEHDGENSSSLNIKQNKKNSSAFNINDFIQKFHRKLQFRYALSVICIQNDSIQHLK